MLVIRPVVPGDRTELINLFAYAGVGMTTLPVSEEQLERRIIASERSFLGSLPQAERCYVFVLEDTETNHIVGICAIEAAVGLKEPWYNYRVSITVHSCAELHVYSRHDTLFLCNDHTGVTELCSLFLRPDYRVGRNGALLSKSRFLFIAQFNELFAPLIVAEMRGVGDLTGRSPFWEAIGRRFFCMDFAEADYLSGIGKKTFVAELMPKYPIYIDMLPAEAQEVIGVTHESTRPARALLEMEGFRYAGYVDIFDAGPTLQAYTSEIRAIKESKLAHAVLLHSGSSTINTAVGNDYLVSNLSPTHFRAIVVNLTQPIEQEMPLTVRQAQLLGVQEDDMVRYVLVSPTAAKR